MPSPIWKKGAIKRKNRIFQKIKTNFHNTTLFAGMEVGHHIFFMKNFHRQHHGVFSNQRFLNCDQGYINRVVCFGVDSEGQLGYFCSVFSHPFSETPF